MVFWDAIVAPQMALRLVPEVFNSVDVITLIGKLFAVIDAMVLKLGDIQNIVSSKAVRINNAVWFDALADNPH